MKVFSTYLVAVALGCTLLGCSKKEDATPSKTELLTNKNWVVTAFTVSPGVSVGGTTITDVYAQTPACSRDDISRFETPNVFKDDEGASKCNATDPQTITGTWVFNSDQTVLTVTENGSAQSFNISSLTSNQMVLTVSQVANNVTYTYTITYKS